MIPLSSRMGLSLQMYKLEMDWFSIVVIRMFRSDIHTNFERVILLSILRVCVNPLATIITFSKLSSSSLL
jgi:hypothetical protein